MLLPGEVEADVVHPVRPAVDGEHERILSRRIEVRRLDDPSLDLVVVHRLVPDLLDLAEGHATENVFVHLRELRPLARIRETECDDVARHVGRREGPHRHAPVSERAQREHVLAARQLADAPVRGYEVQVAGAFRADGQVEAAAIVGPLHAVDLPVEVARDEARIRAVPTHHVYARVPVGVIVEVASPVGDEIASGRGDGPAVLPAPRRELTDITRRHVDRVHLGFTPGQLRILGAERREDELATVRCPLAGRMIPVPIRQLPSSPSLGGDDEDVPPPLIHEALPILPVVGPRDDLRSRHPRGSLRTTRGVHRPGGLAVDGHGEGDRTTVGRPA